MANKLVQKLNARLSAHAVIENVSTELNILLDTTSSNRRFDNPQELRNHLTEGALLNIGKIASGYLAVPSGEYVIWTTPAKNTILVPTTSVVGNSDLLTTESPKQFEIATSKLLGAWNKVERTLSERMANPGQENLQQGPPDSRSGGEEDALDPVKGHFRTAPHHKPDDPYTFGSTVGRTALWQAMQRANMSVSELADKVGVDKSTISRLLRDVKDGPGDPHGRNPSVAVAQKIASVLGVDIDQVLPPAEDLDMPQKRATHGSGRGGAGKFGRRGNQSYRQGNTGTSESMAHRAATLMVQCKLNPMRYISEHLISYPGGEAVLNQLLASPKIMAEWEEHPDPVSSSADPGKDSDFDRAITALDKIIKTHGHKVARMGDKRFDLVHWLKHIVGNLEKIKGSTVKPDKPESIQRRDSIYDEINQMPLSKHGSDYHKDRVKALGQQ